VLDRVQQFAACQQPTQVSEQIMDAGVAEFSRDRLLHLLPRLVGVRALSLPEACQSRPPKTPVVSARDLDEPRTDQRCHQARPPIRQRNTAPAAKLRA
jgi:hypothetical protein